LSNKKRRERKKKKLKVVISEKHPKTRTNIKAKERKKGLNSIKKNFLKR